MTTVKASIADTEFATVPLADIRVWEWFTHNNMLYVRTDRPPSHHLIHCVVLNGSGSITGAAEIHASCRVTRVHSVSITYQPERVK